MDHSLGMPQPVRGKALLVRRRHPRTLPRLPASSQVGASVFRREIANYALQWSLLPGYPSDQHPSTRDLIASHGLYVSAWPRTLRSLTSPVPVAAALAGGTAVAAYLDAKFHIRHDLRAGSVSTNVGKAMDFLAQKMAQDKM